MMKRWTAFHKEDLLPKVVRQRIDMGWQILMLTVSFAVVGAVVVDYGFVLDAAEKAFVRGVYNVAWWVYLIAFTLQLVFQWKYITRRTAGLTLFLGTMLYLSALPRFFTLGPSWQGLAGVWSILQNKYFLIAILGLFALQEVSKALINLVNRKTNPALLMTVSFAVIIAFGALLLLLPRSTHEHIRLSLVDALFVSTSAVCVTGLSPVDLAATFSREGLIVIALLVQTGGLGVMTITSFFAIFFMGGTGLYSQFALRDVVGTEMFGSLLSTLLTILGFTFVIEGIGALFLWLSIHGTLGMTLHEEVFFAVFHSISAFCNAGFSTLSGNLGNPSILTGHNGVFLVISLLIVLGGIGFPLLANFKQVLGYCLRTHLLGRWRRGEHLPRYMHLTNINTKIVLTATAVLIASGTLIIALLEWNGAFAAMPAVDKWVQALFNAVAPRTAGFNSVDLTHFSVLTIILYTLFMWIGGASQSTAGGIKVNTLAVALANLRAVIRGQDHVVIFNREVPSDSVRRASATIFGTLLTILVAFVALVIMEPHLSVRGLLFETVSAFCTVGSSLNITPHLGADSKLLVSLLMFLGRVGLITVLMTLIRQTGTSKYHYPKDNVIIN